MNTLESCNITSPFGKPEECSKFTIDDISMPFVLHNITVTGRKYTLGLWVKSETNGSLFIQNTDIPVTSEWAKHTIIFDSTGINLDFVFATVGTYYIYHPKLEIGNKATDYSPAPEDAVDYGDATYLTKNEGELRISQAESLIQQLSDSISMVVAGLESMSFMEQTENGWTFGLGSVQSALDKAASDLSALNNEIGNTNDTIDALNQAVNELSAYVKIRAYENEPCIELGAGNSDFKLLITNTRIMFMEGSAVPTYISNQTMYIDKLRVETELQQGDFVWTQRANGNLGLMWKEVTS